MGTRQGCYVLFWTKSSKQLSKNSNCKTTDLPSHTPSKLDKRKELIMTFSCGYTSTHKRWSTGKYLHSSAPRRYWMQSTGPIEGNSWYEQITIYIYIYIYIYIEREREREISAACLSIIKITYPCSSIAIHYIYTHTRINTLTPIHLNYICYPYTHISIDIFAPIHRIIILLKCVFSVMEDLCILILNSSVFLLSYLLLLFFSSSSISDYICIERIMTSLPWSPLLELA